MYPMQPNIAMPMTRPTSVARLKFRLRNRCNGMIGAAARRSTRTNPTPATSAMPIRARIIGELHS
jgi:hypothetical protein